MDCQFRLKTVRFKSNFVKLLSQNENGPCPLLAIANALILRQQLVLPNESISGSTLIEAIANSLFSINEEENSKIDNNPTIASAQAREQLKSHRSEQLNYIVDILPTLMRGLDVNVKFNDADQFEYTQEMSVFDGFNLRCYHGWVVDADDEHAPASGVLPSSSSTTTAQPSPLSPHSVMSRLSYNECTNRIVNFGGQESVLLNQLKQLDDDIQEELLIALGRPEPTVDKVPPPPTRREIIQYKLTTLREEHKVITEFLEQTASQLTFHGLIRLHDHIEEGTVSIFFRNNHFNVLYKHQGSLFVLVTDEGFVHPGADDVNVIVWESLQDISG